ncbi:MAG: hypothetical protein Q9M36_15230 [Sulfurovum sp.]|nr:hypothetical protein [Sulfurovum sp.]
MKKITIKSYAIKHKLSLFNVMKMVKSGKLHSITETEGEREVTYIVLNDSTEEEVTRSIRRSNPIDSTSIQEELADLKTEVEMLKKEIAIIKSQYLS